MWIPFLLIVGLQPLVILTLQIIPISLIYRKVFQLNACKSVTRQYQGIGLAECVKRCMTAAQYCNGFLMDDSSKVCTLLYYLPVTPYCNNTPHVVWELI